MVLDTSALLAILLDEPERRRFSEAIAQAGAAREAFRRYGKGRRPAALNFGDCFAYALARTRGEPLLFKGADFALTDLRPALEPPPAG